MSEAKHSAGYAAALCLLIFSGAFLCNSSPCWSQSPAKSDSQSLSGTADSATDRAPFSTQATPESLPPLFGNGQATGWLHQRRLRLYGWVDGGLTHASTGDGLLNDAPSPNRFSDEALLNGAWLVADRLSLKEGWSWGFRFDFYAGSDAALLRPSDSFGPQGTHLGTDVRQAYLSLHSPGITKRGIDFTLGRQNVPIGFETLMGPYRPMYSESYFWIKYEVGSTAALATIPATPKLDLILGTVMGYNTVFKLRGRAPAYVTRLLYRPNTDKSTQLIATVFTGPEPASITPGHLGTWQTISELQARHIWTSRFHQVVQAHYAVNVRDPVTKGDTATQGAFVISAFKVSPKLFLNSRQEWFADPHGIRNETAGTYSEAAFGLNYEPLSWINFRPEVRGDFAGQKSFSASLGGPPHRNQFSIAFDVMVKFDAFR